MSILRDPSALDQVEDAYIRGLIGECPEFCVNLPYLFDQSIVAFGRVTEVAKPDHAATTP